MMYKIIEENIKQKVMEIRKNKNKKVEEFKEFRKIVSIVEGITTKEEREEFFVVSQGEIGIIYVSNGYFREWGTEREIDNLPVDSMVDILNLRQKNLENLYEFLEEVNQIYK